MQQLLKRFYDVIKVRIRFANSQLKKKTFLKLHMWSKIKLLSFSYSIFVRKKYFKVN